jgi:hypothetical protein
MGFTIFEVAYLHGVARRPTRHVKNEYRRRGKPPRLR